MTFRFWKHRWLFGVVLGMGATTMSAQAAVTVEGALNLTPVHASVDFDRPAADKVGQCKLESYPDNAGWAVRSESGQLLRRFLDTNKDRKLDQWCYYKNGIEVYRDIDTDFNGKADQYRWLGTAGMRWGMDTNEDGEIDAWKAISPEEVTAEVVAALREKSARRFQRLLITAEELASLGAGSRHGDDFRERSELAKKGFAELAQSQRIVDAKSEWLQFGAARPGVIPAGTEGSTKDLIIYDNAAAIIETDGKHAQVFVGTLINVGGGWRIVDLPKSEASDGTFISLVNRPPTDGTGSGGVNEAMQKLIGELERIDKAIMAQQGDKAKLNAERANTLEKLAQSASGPEDRAAWIKQFADTVAAAVQSRDFPKGTERLQAMQAELAKNPQTKELVPYVQFRAMAADYGDRLSSAKDNEHAKIQDRWIQDLEKFASDFPQAEETAEALLQLGLGYEFAGNDESAGKAYARIVSGFPKSDNAKKAEGAKFRLESVGKPFRLNAKTVDGKTYDIAQFHGRVVLVQYWATWCELCKQDMQQIRTLQSKYEKKGLHVVGINLDNDVKQVTQYLASARWPWPQLFEPGGMESRLANEMGIQTLPTMILVDKSGRVVRRNIHAAELDAELEKLLK